MLGMSILVFVMIRLIPGTPAQVLLGTNPDPATVIAINREWGLNKPIYFQYFTWLYNIIHGNLGNSIVTYQPVLQITFAALKNTLLLSGASILFFLAIGLSLGISSGMRQDGIIDKAATSFSLFFVSIPSFWFAILLIVLFSVHLHWLPSGGLAGPRLFGFTCFHTRGYFNAISD